HLIAESLSFESDRIDVRTSRKRTGSPAIADNVFDLQERIAESCQGRGNRGVDDLEVTATGQLLEFHQREIRLDPRRIAIHDQADRAGRRDDRDLSIAIAVFFSELDHTITFAPGRLEHLDRTMAGGDADRPDGPAFL